MGHSQGPYPGISTQAVMPAHRMAITFDSVALPIPIKLTFKEWKNKYGFIV